MMSTINTYSQLASNEQELIDKAVEAARRAYCPYSKFPVGAAILARNDAGQTAIFTGCNVENASYPAGTCAEQTAAVKAVSEGYRRFEKIVVACISSPGGTPCGICRQVLREFGKDAEVLCVADLQRSINRWSMNELFPASFGPDSLA